MEVGRSIGNNCMATITKEDILKISRMSHIKIHDDEIESLIDRLGEVLNYAARVQEIAVDVVLSPSKNINVLRDDVAIKFDAQLIVACAPESEEHYFVVPAILESNK